MTITLGTLWDVAVVAAVATAACIITKAVISAAVDAVRKIGR